MPVSSIQPRKQRLHQAQAPQHKRQKRLAAHLSETLLVKYNRRRLPIVRGDTVRVVRGAFRGHEEKIASVDASLGKVTVEGVTVTKADGTKTARPVDPSNLVLVRLNLTDPLRRERILASAHVDEATKAKLQEELEKESAAQKEEIEAFRRELKEREEAEKAKRREEEGGMEPGVDPVTQRAIMRKREEHRHEHPGGEHLDEGREKAAEAEGEPAEEKKPPATKKAEQAAEESARTEGETAPESDEAKSNPSQTKQERESKKEDQ